MTVAAKAIFEAVQEHRLGNVRLSRVVDVGGDDIVIVAEKGRSTCAFDRPGKRRFRTLTKSDVMELALG